MHIDLGTRLCTLTSIPNTENLDRKKLHYTIIVKLRIKQPIQSI